MQDSCLSVNGHNIYGIRLNEEFPIKHNLFSVVSTIFHELTYTIKAGYKNFISLKKPEHLDLVPLDGKDGLVVFFHGLNGKPSVWNDHLGKFKKLAEKNEETSLAFYTPLVPNKGHCTLADTGIDMIVENIEQWIALHPNKPVVLFGQSNGSRVALEIETRLRERAPQTPVSLSLTGPVLFGTSLIDKITEKLNPNLLSKISFGSLTPVCIEELRQGSDSSKKLLRKARKNLPEGCAERRYRMYAPVIDSHILEKGSALPILNANRETFKNEKHYLVPGYGHNSIVNAFTQEQVEKSLHWIKRKNYPQFSKFSCVHCLSKSKDAGGTLNLPIEKRTLVAKIVHRVEMIFKTIGMLFTRFRDNLQSRWNGKQFLTVEKNEKDGKLCYPISQLPWNISRSNKSQGLNLCIHGLNGSPLHWTRYSKQLKKEHPEMDTVVPNVALKGNCPIEIAAEPLLAIIEDYLKKHPGNPVNIIGTSNGGRIAAYIESRLNPSLIQGSSLTITSIAGVHYGTTVIDKLKNMGLLRFAKLNAQLAKDFEWGSKTAQNLHNDWREKQFVWKQENCNVRHLFCASTEDEQVQSIAASLPLPPTDVLDNNNFVYSQKIYHGESHTSIVEHAQEDVMNWIFTRT